MIQPNPMQKIIGVLYRVSLSIIMIASGLGADTLKTNDTDTTFGGPGSVLNQMAQDEEEKASRTPILPDMGIKDTLEADWGLTFGFDYNLLYQYSDQSRLNERDALGGVARFYGSWKPFKDEEGAGSLIFKIENRHTLGSYIDPKLLGSEFGYAGLTAVTFSDAGTILSNFYWHQAAYDNRLGFVVGIVDVSDYLDVYGLVNIWTDFNNLSFTTNPTIPVPNQGLGAAVRWLFTPNVYVVAGIADANGNPEDTEDSVKSFFDDSEYFKHIEFGWIGSWDKRITDNIHITAWQVDERTKVGVDDGWGMTFSFSHTYEAKWLPFLRAGYADGGGAIVDRSLSTGMGYKLNDRNDYIGFGIGWASAQSDIDEIKERDQYTMETYYRLQPLPGLQIVPSLQYIRNPAFDLSNDDVFIGALRMRMVF